jgi:hypothetical protein
MQDKVLLVDLCCLPNYQKLEKNIELFLLAKGLKKPLTEEQWKNFLEFSKQESVSDSVF